MQRMSNGKIDKDKIEEKGIFYFKIFGVDTY